MADIKVEKSHTNTPVPSIATPSPETFFTQQQQALDAWKKVVDEQIARMGSMYEEMAKTGAPGASLANLGLADLALYRGRFRDAESLLKVGIAEDTRRQNTGGLASKYTALAGRGAPRTGQRYASYGCGKTRIRVIGPGGASRAASPRVNRGGRATGCARARECIVSRSAAGIARVRETARRGARLA